MIVRRRTWLYRLAGQTFAQLISFKKPVTAGDQLILKARLARQIRGIWKFEATAEVDGTVVAEAELMCTMKDVSSLGGA